MAGKMFRTSTFRTAVAVVVRMYDLRMFRLSGKNYNTVLNKKNPQNTAQRNILCHTK